MIRSRSSNALGIPTSPARKFRSGRSYVAEVCSSQLLLLGLLSLCGSLLIAHYAADEHSDLRKMFEVCQGIGRRRRCYSKPWMALVVGNVLLFSTAIMISGVRSHFAFVGAVTIFGSLGIITTRDALAGFASPGNIAFQAVLVLIGGIQDSGVLDHVFFSLLGTGQLHRAALIRVQVLVALTSALVQQTTVVVAAAPALQRWAPQVGLLPREVLLPVACVGGMSQNFMVVTSTVALTIHQMMPEAELRMLDPAAVSVVLTVVACIYGTLASGPLLGSGTKAPLRTQAFAEHVGHQYVNRYVLFFEVADQSFLIGFTPAQIGLLSLPGALLVSTNFPVDEPMAAGNHLCFAATAAGVAQIRHRSPGLMLKRADPLAELGAQRHRRRLFEIGVAPGSSLVGCKLPLSLDQASCLAARRPKGPIATPLGHSSSNSPISRPIRQPGALHKHDERTELVGPLQFGDSLTTDDERAEFTGPLQVGDILLVEAFLELADLPEAHTDFSFIAIVPESAPPRHGRPVDRRRGWLALLLLVCVIVCSALHVGEFVFLGLAAVCFCLIFNVVHREAVLQRLNLPIFLTIAGGLGVGQAIRVSGLANALAQCIVALGRWATMGHPMGILVAFSLITSLLSNLMSNTATAALMAPIAIQVCAVELLNVKTAALVMLFSANAAFALPFATSSNILIKGMGPYDFFDYLRFGVPLQLLLLFLIPMLCAFQCGISQHLSDSAVPA